MLVHCRLTVKVCSDVDNHGLESVTSKHVYALGPKGKAKTRDAISADTVNPILPSKHAAIGNKKVWLLTNFFYSLFVKNH